MFNLKKIATAFGVTLATVGAAAAMSLPASAATRSVPVPTPIVGVHPGIHPGLGLRPGLGTGIGSCGLGLGTCGSGLGLGLGTCGTCGLGLGLGSPIYVSQVPWYAVSSASLCDSGCGLGISTLPATVYLNGLNGDCAFSAGGALIPGLGGVGWHRHLGGLGLLR